MVQNITTVCEVIKSTLGPDQIICNSKLELNNIQSTLDGGIFTVLLVLLLVISWVIIPSIFKDIRWFYLRFRYGVSIADYEVERIPLREVRVS